MKDLSVLQAYKKCLNQTSHQLIDVRTPLEHSQGIAQGALCLPLDELQKLTTQLSKDSHCYVMCQTGLRSKIACQKLSELGYHYIYHVYQGYQSWLHQGLPIETPQIDQATVRYQRHHQLANFGKKSQDKLLQSNVLLIGAGGLGSSSALYLAAAGVGQITLLDDDVVSLSNLHRQIIHQTANLGQLKVESAKKQLTALNPDIEINTIAQRIDSTNCDGLVEQADVIIDGSDNLTTRYLINDCCKKHKKALVYAAVYQYEAQLSSFDFRKDNSPCLRCLFPQTEGFEPENCSTAGVLGVVPGLAGIMQATEAIKLITNVGETLLAKLLIMDLFSNEFRTLKYRQDNSCCQK